MRKLLPALALVVFATACGGEAKPDWSAQAEEMCVQAVAEKMKDPGSVEFRGVAVSYEGEAATIGFQNEDGTTDEDVQGEYWEVRGEVNAKNGFGAMVGFRDFRCQANKYEGRDMKTGYVKVERG